MVGRIVQALGTKLYIVWLVVVSATTVPYYALIVYGINSEPPWDGISLGLLAGGSSALSIAIFAALSWQVWLFFFCRCFGACCYQAFSREKGAWRFSVQPAVQRRGSVGQ